MSDHRKYSMLWMPLRGRREINFDEPEPIENDENFRVFFRQKVKNGDDKIFVDILIICDKLEIESSIHPSSSQ